MKFIRLYIFIGIVCLIIVYFKVRNLCNKQTIQTIQNEIIRAKELTKDLDLNSTQYEIV